MKPLCHVILSDSFFGFKSFVTILKYWDKTWYTCLDYSNNNIIKPFFLCQLVIDTPCYMVIFNKWISVCLCLWQGLINVNNKNAYIHLLQTERVSVVTYYLFIKENGLIINIININN